MRIGLFIQARANSHRLPNKVFKEIGGKQVLQHVIDTCQSIDIFKKVLKLDTRVLILEKDFEFFCQEGYKADIVVCAVKDDDLLGRYKTALLDESYDAFIRITSDCPLLPKSVLEAVIKGLMTYDYVTNTMNRTFLDGHDCQGMSTKAFAWYINQLDHEEHLFAHLEQNALVQDEFEKAGYTINQIVDMSPQILNPYSAQNKLSVDTQEDLDRLQKIYEGMKK